MCPTKCILFNLNITLPFIYTVCIYFLIAMIEFVRIESNDI